MSSMSYFRICSMRSIQKTTFCGFIALLNKVLDFGGQLVNKLSFLLALRYRLAVARKYFYPRATLGCEPYWKGVQPKIKNSKCSKMIYFCILKSVIRGLPSVRVRLPTTLLRSTKETCQERKHEHDCSRKQREVCATQENTKRSSISHSVFFFRASSYAS